MSNPTSNFGWQMPEPTDLVTNLPADFEVFGQAVDTDFVDLLGGTTGQVLSKTSATDLDFTWVSPNPGDITEVTVSSPITGGGSSGSVNVAIQDGTTAQKGAVQLENSTSSTSTTTAAVPANVKTANDLAAAAVPKSTVTTNGDLIYGTGSATVGRIGIGSTSQVLTVAGGIPSWATPAGGGGMTLLSTTTLTGTSTTVSSIDQTYVNLLVFMTGVSSATAGQVTIQSNASTTGSYGIQWYNATNGNLVTDISTVSVGLQDSMSANNANNFTSLLIQNYASSTTYKGFNSLLQFISVGNVKTEIGAGVIRTTSAITSLKFQAPGVGTWSAGTVLIYGVK
jgi:hypothetical protein